MALRYASRGIFAALSVSIGGAPSAVEIYIEFRRIRITIDNGAWFCATSATNCDGRKVVRIPPCEGACPATPVLVAYRLVVICSHEDLLFGMWY